MDAKLILHRLQETDALILSNTFLYSSIVRGYIAKSPTSLKF